MRLKTLKTSVPYDRQTNFSPLCSSLLGCVVTVVGRLTFISNMSMEIEVLVDSSSLVEAREEKYRAVSAFFTYISLDKDNKPLPVPPLKVGTTLSLLSKVCQFIKT